MSVTPEDVRRLVAAAVIDSEAGKRILAFEALQPRRREFPGIVEIVAYLGVAIVGAGIVVLMAANWEPLATWVRLSVPAFAALAAFASGLGFRRMARPDLERAASVAWLLAGALVVTTASVAGAEAGWAAEDVALAAGLVAVPTAITTWWASRTHVQLAAIGGAVFLLSIALNTQGPDDGALLVFGLSLAAWSLAGLIATETAFLIPRPTARFLAAASLAVGASFAGVPPAHPAAELATLVVPILLIAASIRFGVLTYTVFAVLTAFAGLVTAILRHIDDPTLAALALIGVGLVLLGAIAGISRYRPWSSSGAPP